MLSATTKQDTTVNLEIFVVKIFSGSMAATKINLTKLACTINANAVRGRSYEKFFTRKFIIRKFLYTKFPDLWYITFHIPEHIPEPYNHLAQNYVTHYGMLD